MHVKFRGQHSGNGVRHLLLCGWMKLDGFGCRKNVPGDPVEQKNSITWLGYFIQCNKNSPNDKRRPKGRKKYGNRRRHCEGLRQRPGKPVGCGTEQTARRGSRVGEAGRKTGDESLD